MEAWNKKVKWSRVQRQYIEWLALPYHLRVPPTLEEVAAVLNRKPVTLKRWSTQPGFQKEVDLAIGRRLLQRRANVYETIGEKAEAGDFRFVKILLEIIRHYPIPKDDASQKQPLPHYTIEDYHASTKRLRAWLKENNINGQETGIEW